jgi:CHAT domain-containing protein
LLGPEDPLRARNEDGRALYRMLVAPARDLIAPGGRVVVLCDGVLSELNFETLLVDAANPQDGPHYWIEDADVVSAPSLLMLSRTQVSEGGPIRRAPRSARSLLRAGSGASAEDAGANAPRARLLLVGDAVSPGPDYPELPNASVEMRAIEKHFGPQEATVFARGAANAGAYLGSEPRRFSYIDFVAHGVASRTDPLDSAIILSRMPGGEDSFKLYAREIMQHRIDARLVTIAACYGGGTRSYAGEGLVGLSWAFLRAGAHNVIGALWEVSDESAPRLMDGLYQGLQDGLPPSAALRQAKLKLLHEAGPQRGEFRRPFFWGAFQLYTVESSR